jgi:uncharacterized protein (TIGR02284 family)
LLHVEEGGCAGDVFFGEIYEALSFTADRAARLALESHPAIVQPRRPRLEGFGKAAKGVHSDELRKRLIRIARQRAEFADEPAGQVKAIDGEPAASGHLSGIQHRGWRELETGLRPKDDATLLAECQTGQENTLRHYDQALRRELPAGVLPVVEQQRAAVAQALADLGRIELVRHAG